MYWRTIKDGFGDELLDSHNNALKKLSRCYERAFTQKTGIRSHAILNDIIQALEKCSMLLVKKKRRLHWDYSQADTLC